MRHHELTEELRDQASLFSLGLLNGEEAARFDAHLNDCPLCTEEVRAGTELAAAITATLAEDAAGTLPAPPPRVKEELMRRITVPEHSPVPLVQAMEESLVIRAGEGRWRKVLPGIEVKRLFVDPITKSVTSLVRVAAGAVYPAHLHVGLEHLYVLDGDIVFDDHTLSSGDYEVRSPNTKHSSATTAPGEGCLLLVINSGKDEFLP